MNKPSSFIFVRQKFCFLIFIVLLIGIFLRFINLDYKVYWHDESYTSLRISGYRQEEVVGQVYQKNIVNIQELGKYQKVTSEKNLRDTLNSLALEDAMHPPLYFVAIRYWSQIFNKNNSIFYNRLFSVIFGILCLPIMYWLCLELFNHKLTSLIATSLMAISPFHLLYAQEARQYSLLTLIILISSVALLRAIKINNLRNWIFYTVTIILGLYTHLFFILVPLGYSIYILIIRHFKLADKVITSYIKSSLIAGITFIPWAIVIINNLKSIDRFTSWVQKDTTIIWLIREWLLALGRLFIDWNYEFRQTNIVLYLSLILTIYSLYYLYRKTEPKIWLFVVCLVITTFLGLAVPDILFGGIRSSAERYLIPCFIGIEIAVSYLIADKMLSSDFKRYNQFLWSSILCILLTTGLLSCLKISQAPTWWNKQNNYNFALAKIINQKQNPLIITSGRHGLFGAFMSLSHYLDDKVNVMFLIDKKDEQNRLKLIPKDSDIFLIFPSRETLNYFKPNYKSEEIYFYPKQKKSNIKYLVTHK